MSSEYETIEDVLEDIGDVLKEAYYQGWIECTEWADRDDLIADIGSSEFDQSMRRRLRGIPLNERDCEDGS